MSNDRSGYQARYYHANRIANRWKTLLRKYKISREKYDALLADQGHACKICKQPVVTIDQYESGNSRPENAACLDHCHATGKIRGILCMPCNLLLGYAKDKTSTLQSAIAYLQLDHIGE